METDFAMVEIKTETFLMDIQNCPPVRLTKELDNGNMAILQIVDPENVPQITKALRMLPGKVGKFLKSVEAAFRVGMVVYRNSMRGSSSRGRKKGKKKNEVQI